MVTVNGQARELPPGAVVAQVVADLLGQSPATAGGPARGIAVAVNGEVVPRASWAGTMLRDGDRIEVLTAAQGG
jgi:sulfur carrier protein